MTTFDGPGQRAAREARVGDYRRGSRVRTTPAGTWFPAVSPSDQPAGLLLLHPGVDTRVLVPVLRQLAALRLPGVLSVQAELTNEAGRNWMVVDGPPVPALSEIVDEDGPHRTPGNAAALLSDLASTLATLHQSGLLHGRLATSSVVLSQGGTAVLTDWATKPEATRADDIAAWTQLARLLAEKWCADSPESAAALARAVGAAASDGLVAGYDQLRALAAESRRDVLADYAAHRLAEGARPKPLRKRTRIQLPPELAELEEDEPPRPARPAAAQPVQPAAGAPAHRPDPPPPPDASQEFPPVEPVAAEATPAASDAPSTSPAPAAPAGAEAPPAPAGPTSNRPEPPQHEPPQHEPPRPEPTGPRRDLTTPPYPDTAQRPGPPRFPGRPDGPGPFSPRPQQPPHQPGPPRYGPRPQQWGPPPEQQPGGYEPQPRGEPVGHGSPLEAPAPEQPAGPDVESTERIDRSAERTEKLAPAPPKETERSSPLRMVLIGVLIVALAITSGLLYLRIQSATSAAGLAVVGNPTLQAVLHGQRCMMYASLVTNGKPGTLTYRWVGDEATPGLVESVSVGDGQKQLVIGKQWQAGDSGGTDPVVSIQLFDPSPGSALVQPALGCQQ